MTPMDETHDDSQPSQDSVMTVTQDDRHEILYFAFGSNLSTEQMRQRCPYSTPIGLGSIEGWKWIINERGYANIVRIPKYKPVVKQSSTQSSTSHNTDQYYGKVYGLLYLLPPQDEEKLDGFEGVPWAYEKQQCDAKWIRDDSGGELNENVRVLLYVDGLRVDESIPKVEYIDRMERGIDDAVKNWGLDEGYANTVMRRFWKK